MTLGVAPCGGSQKDVAQFARIKHFSYKVIPVKLRNLRDLCCGSLLREASSSSVNEGLPTWNLRAKESGVRNRRYSIRYPFAADAEMLELESGSRARGVASELLLGGCFVRALRPRKARVRGTLLHGNKKVKMLAVVRVVIPRSEWASSFWALIQTPMQHCRPGSKIFANRAVSCRHIGKL